MASISSESNGRKSIQFIASDGKRKSIRLGKMTQRQADRFKAKVENIIGAGFTGGVEEETADWLTKLDDRMYARLAAVGLVRERTGATALLGAFIDSFTANLTSIKQNTRENFTQLRFWLVDYLGETYDIRRLDPAAAEDWRAHMVKKGLGDNTIRRHIGRARQLLKSAIRRGMYRGPNPFDGMSATVGSDKARLFYVTREMATKVLAACPDTQWKLLFALSRYGGLRCPSEHLALKWSDVTWGDAETPASIRIPSPKTEHIEGKECRVIPLFPELRPVLMEAFEQAEPGTEYVITRYRQANSNLRTQLNRIIARAGMVPWPKLFQNLRSTRETELAETVPLQYVCAWIGNTEAVAKKHYLQLRDEIFARHTSAAPALSPTGVAAGETLAPALTENPVQNPVQQPAESTRTVSQASMPISAIRPIKRLNSTDCETVRNGLYPRQDSNL
jgi:integrase